MGPKLSLPASLLAIRHDIPPLDDVEYLKVAQIKFHANRNSIPLSLLIISFTAINIINLRLNRFLRVILEAPTILESLFSAEGINAAVSVIEAMYAIGGAKFMGYPSCLEAWNRFMRPGTCGSWSLEKASREYLDSKFTVCCALTLTIASPWRVYAAGENHPEFAVHMWKSMWNMYRSELLQELLFQIPGIGFAPLKLSEILESEDY